MSLIRSEKVKLIDSPKLIHRTYKYSVNVYKKVYHEYEYEIEAVSELDAEEQAIAFAEEEHDLYGESYFETGLMLLEDICEETEFDDPNQITLELS